MEYKQNDFVEFDYQSIKGYGRVCGLSTTKQPIIGVGYILELLQEIPGYEYTHIVVFDNYMKEALNFKRDYRINEIIND